MDHRWLKGTEDKETRKKQVRSYRAAYEELTKILEQDFAKKEACRDYNSPNWAYEQISINEYNQALKDIIKLINIKD